MNLFGNQTGFSEDWNVVKDFCDLVDSSEKLFNGLRDLPHYGQQHWQPYFAKTFDSYTKLWKFQQQYRTELDRSYHLKRWQIGEIASKIGQLYYHYYLRTSETNYLNEAFQFYSAIRSRNYYKGVKNEENCEELMLKRYRYYARFIIVCLLLNHRHDASALIKDLSRHIKNHGKILQERDQPDWEEVIKEIQLFPEADPVEILDAESYEKCQMTMRLLPNTLPVCESGFKPVLFLGDAIIVGNFPSQRKVSEMTIDMLRMVHVLERAQSSKTNVKLLPTEGKSLNNIKRENPHKYLLYRPDVFSLFTHLSTAIKELQPSNALLLYMSAQGRFPKLKKPDISVQGNGYDGEGVITKEPDKDENNNMSIKKSTHLNDIDCLQPADLYPFTRKPIILIIDSDNASIFSKFPDLFGQPFVSLMSPNRIPPSIKGDQKVGRLMTIFFYSPLMGFMLVCGIERVSNLVYHDCLVIFNKILNEIQKIFLRSKSVDCNFLLFFGDDFLRLILLRFTFFACTLNFHKLFKDKAFLPTSKPDLPSDFFNSTSITRAIIDLAETLGTQGMFDIESLNK